MQDFKKLRVWQRAHQLRLDVYAATRPFPSEERFGLTSQIRRSASSIGANIAESCGYRGRRDSARFLYVAVGSCCETRDHVTLARDLGYLDSALAAKLENELESIRRMLVALIQRMTLAPAT